MLDWERSVYQKGFVKRSEYPSAFSGGKIHVYEKPSRKWMLRVIAELPGQKTRWVFKSGKRKMATGWGADTLAKHLDSLKEYGEAVRLYEHGIETMLAIRASENELTLVDRRIGQHCTVTADENLLDAWQELYAEGDVDGALKSLAMVAETVGMASAGSYDKPLGPMIRTQFPQLLPGRRKRRLV